MVTNATWGDAWRWRGLGKIAMRIWDLLGEPGFTSDKLPARIGVTPRTVRRHLARLKRFGLVRHDGGRRWVRVDDAAILARTAQDLGVAGKGERQREQHLRERFAFHMRREGLAK